MKKLILVAFLILFLVGCDTQKRLIDYEESNVKIPEYTCKQMRELIDLDMSAIKKQYDSYAVYDNGIAETNYGINIYYSEDELKQLYAVNCIGAVKVNGVD